MIYIFRLIIIRTEVLELGGYPVLFFITGFRIKQGPLPFKLILSSPSKSQQNQTYPLEKMYPLLVIHKCLPTDFEPKRIYKQTYCHVYYRLVFKLCLKHENEPLSGNSHGCAVKLSLRSRLSWNGMKSKLRSLPFF